MNDHDDLAFIADALPAFVSEGQEQIASIEQLLLQLEDTPDDRELLDALFRCAHTVKGSAGIFGLDAVVAFTHHVETLLDCLREGELALTPEISTLLLQCNDQIRQLIDQATGGIDDASGQATREALVARLDALHPGASQARPGETTMATKAADQMQAWQVSARFGTDTFRNGMDPLALLSYVGQIGTLDAVHCDDEAVPALDTLDPESCH
ncbi:MAG TPA: Hpt domain-containing protein, partial [Piscinibacter sp.]|nr:Hpt domain-containing protein [Piscinibacter sp.]